MISQRLTLSSYCVFAVPKQGLDLSGLTETSNYGLPEGSLDTGSALDPFDWSQAPPFTESDPKRGSDEECNELPEELLACQRDAASPLKPTPTQSGYTRFCLLQCMIRNAETLLAVCSVLAGHARS